MERDKGLCFGIESYCGRVAVDVHEVVPRSHFGAKTLDKCYEPRNRVCLCRDCHVRAHTLAARRAILRRMRERYGYDYDDSPYVGYVDELEGWHGP